MHYEQFCRYRINLDHYLLREIPSEIQKCKTFRYSPKQTLSTEIGRYIKEFGSWDKDWDVNGVRPRIRKGWRFYTFRPKIGIRGWLWVSPRGIVNDMYISQKYRGKGWGTQLLYQALNDVAESNWPKVTFIVDAWDDKNKYFIERIFSGLNCSVQVDAFEEKVFKNSRKRITWEN